ncbi:hypothetical protein [Nocardia crassostreae]|uniref:hypothetical protein n=1 Tax=Nocardia crassostreae TaxID=53428 RepID=UPI000835C32E|nr:hypothetical protein [Nocardia crassostreae]
MSPTVADLTARTGVDVLDHVDREAGIPVIAGMQAQGDLIVIPLEQVPQVSPHNGRWTEVPPAGIEIIRGGSGANPHVLVADPGSCRWTTRVRDPQGLSLDCLDTTAIAYLLHPEHGGSGIAPGRYLIRRQREHTAPNRTTLVVD